MAQPRETGLHNELNDTTMETKAEAQGLTDRIVDSITAAKDALFGSTGRGSGSPSGPELHEEAKREGGRALETGAEALKSAATSVKDELLVGKGALQDDNANASQAARDKATELTEETHTRALASLQPPEPRAPPEDSLIGRAVQYVGDTVHALEERLTGGAKDATPETGQEGKRTDAGTSARDAADKDHTTIRLTPPVETAPEIESEARDESLFERAKHAVTDTIHSLEERIASGVHAVEERMHTATESAEETAARLREEAAEESRRAQAFGRERLEGVRASAHQARDTAAHKLEETRDAAAEYATAGKERTAAAVHGAREEAGSLAERAKDFVADKVHSLEDRLHGEGTKQSTVADSAEAGGKGGTVAGAGTDSVREAEGATERAEEKAAGLVDRAQEVQQAVHTAQDLLKEAEKKGGTFRP